MSFYTGRLGQYFIIKKNLSSIKIIQNSIKNIAKV